MGVSEERAEQILLEETLSRRRRTTNRSAEEALYRRLIARDVARLTKAGIIIDIPATWPDLSEPDDVAEEPRNVALADDPDGDAAVASDAARDALEKISTDTA